MNNAAALVLLAVAWLDLAAGRAAAEKDGIPAIVHLAPEPPKDERDQARKRREAFAAWVEGDLAKLDLVADERVRAVRCPNASAAEVGAEKNAKGKAEGAIVVLDFQWTVIDTIVTGEEAAAAWTRKLKKAILAAEAAGEEKRKLIAALDRELVKLEADDKAGETAAAVARARTMIEAEKDSLEPGGGGGGRGSPPPPVKVRAKAIVRAREILEKIHAAGRQRVAALKEGKHDLRWAQEVMRVAPKLKKAYPFDDVVDALSDLEAEAATQLR